MPIYVIKLHRYPAGTIAKAVIEEHENDIVDYKVGENEAVIVTRSKALAEQLNKLNGIVKVQIVEIK